VDDILRRRLINALKPRGWTSLDAERAAAIVAGLYQDGHMEWKVWHTQVAGDPSSFRVARQMSAACVFESLLQKRARDVATALNELERPDPDATDSP
jgi:hypothetical protein